MPRPVKCRKVCLFPQILEFIPLQKDEESEEAIILSVDEYEVIRLIDKEGLSQGQCSEFMQIARTTVQRIYESARKKLADMLVEGQPLRIEGGEFWLCDGRSSECGYDGCFKQLYHQQYKKPKGGHIMRVAAAYEDGRIFQHFGRTEQFKVYDIDNGTILFSEVVGTDGKGHGALAGVLGALNVDALICGGIGEGARAALSAAGIQLYGGVTGDADQAVRDLADGKLRFNPDIQCDHHGRHHGEGHACGDHGCGNY